MDALFGLFIVFCIGLLFGWLLCRLFTTPYEFLSDREETGQQTEEMRIFHSGPPPHIGWWNASFEGKDRNAWRWWDGRGWSLAAFPDHTPEEAHRATRWRSKVAAEENGSLILWSDYWPEDARVERMKP